MKIVPVGHALSLFFAITFTICILWGLITPVEMHMHEAWAPLLPGFHWISFPAYLIGLVEVYAYGWFVAVLFVPLFNYFNKRATAA